MTPERVAAAIVGAEQVERLCAAGLVITTAATLAAMLDELRALRERAGADG